MRQMNLQIITLSILIIPLTKMFRKKIHLQRQANLISGGLGQQGLSANGSRHYLDDGYALTVRKMLTVT